MTGPQWFALIATSAGFGYSFFQLGVSHGKRIATRGIFDSLQRRAMRRTERDVKAPITLRSIHHHNKT